MIALCKSTFTIPYHTIPYHEQVCVQLPTSAVNVALPASAAVRRRAAAPRCCGTGRAAIDRYLLAAGPTAANPPHAAAAGERDRQTDGRTPCRYVDPAAHTSTKNARCTDVESSVSR